MIRFLVRRSIQSVVLLLVVTSGVFFLVHLTPGGPDAALLQNPRIGPEQVQRLRENFGLDQPLVVQYVRWLASAARLDFGRSYFYSRPATEVVAERLGPTIQLGVMSYAVALLGVPLGVIAGLNRGRLADVLVRLLATIGHALPTWWLGLTSVVLLSSLTGWLPNGQGHGSIGEWLKYISLPAIVLGLAGLVTFARFVRSGVLDALAEDYVRTAKAKGLPGGLITIHHVLRNALLPVMTLLGGVLPAIVSGALVTEYVFAWPGVGRLFYEAAVSRDYPIVLAVLSLTTFATILGTLLADLSYGIVDPRVRYS
ncbi:MAG TPA: ABC transporter permease [Chloroflexota bacterium]|nr:ABC transporter permease [Chloroflexota bacterium]